jgi:putative two-component system response regulator
MSLRGDSELILVVEDDRQAQSLIARTLERAGYRWDVATDGVTARRMSGAQEYDVVLCELNLPDQSGLELVESLCRRAPDTAAVVVTAIEDPALAERAIELGTYGYILKPFTATEVLVALRGALQRRRLRIENRAQRETLEQIVHARTTALERSAMRLKLSREETVRRLSRAVEYRDEETGGHTERMSAYAALLAGKLGLDDESIRIASPMHDVGKVALPDHMLLRPGSLTPEEHVEMERHTVIGYQILSGSGSALLELGASIALTHHERWDGTGYPRGLAGPEIPMEGQVAAVADVFDALTSDRPYRKAFSIERAVEIMKAERGKHFDPRLVDMFFENMDQVLEIRDREIAPVLAAAPAALVG